MQRKLFAIVVLCLFLYVGSPLLIPVVMGAVLAALLLPALEWMSRFKVSRSTGAAFLTSGITLVVLFPSASLVFFGAKSGVHELQAWKDAPKTGGSWVEALMNTPRVHHMIELSSAWLPVDRQSLIETTQDLTRSVGIKLADLLGGLVTQLPGMAMGFAVMVVSLYFFLADGPRLVSFFRSNSVFSARETERLLDVLAGTCRSVILASIVSGAVQAVLEVIVCVSSATPNVFLIALLVFVSSFIPVVGSAPVTLGVAIQQFIEGRTGAAVALLIASFLIAAIDNLIRPMFLRGSANLHPMLAFVAALGGIQTLGFMGIFLGPIVAALFVVTLEILLGPDQSPSDVH
ncbi:AI-2E family transporter [Bdellovibrionota bacterium FG-2]